VQTQYILLYKEEGSAKHFFEPTSFNSVSLLVQFPDLGCGQFQDYEHLHVVLPLHLLIQKEDNSNCLARLYVC